MFTVVKRLFFVAFLVVWGGAAFADDDDARIAARIKVIVDNDARVNGRPRAVSSASHSNPQWATSRGLPKSATGSGTFSPILPVSTQAASPSGTGSSHSHPSGFAPTRIVRTPPIFRFVEIKIGGAKTKGRHHSILVNGVTYVPIREFAKELAEKTGITLDVVWKRGRVVDIIAGRAEARLSAAVLELWHGHIGAARRVLVPLALQGDPEATLLLNNIEGYPEEQSGTVHFDWQSMPPGKRLTIDGVPVFPGEEMLPLASGEHMAAIWTDGAAVAEKEQAFKLLPHGTKTIRLQL